MIELTNLRIRRADPKNIVIERLVEAKEPGKPPRWMIYGYYGRAEELAIGLFNLALEIPEPTGDLLEQIRLLVAAVRQTEKSLVEAIKMQGHDKR